MSPAEPAPTDDGRPAEDEHGLPPGYLLRPMTVWDIPEVLAHEATLFPLDAWPAHFYEEELAQTGPAGGRDAHGRPPTRDYRVVVRDVPAPGSADDDGPAPGEIVDVSTVITTPRQPSFCFVRFKLEDARERVAFPGSRPVNFQIVVVG